MGTYTARATREEGLYTQARRLDQIERNVRDALALFPDIEPYPENACIIVWIEGECVG